MGSKSSLRSKKKELCPDYCKGICPHFECLLVHRDCQHEGCRPIPRRGCLLGHPWASNLSDKADDSTMMSDISFQGRGEVGGDDDSMSVISDISIDMSVWNKRSNKPCASQSKCWKFDCPYQHPSGWSACMNEDECEDFYCKSNHPYSRTRPCLSGKNCWNLECSFLHPSDWKPCQDGVSCCDFYCTKNHPSGRLSNCPSRNNCRNIDCDYLHPEGWDPTPQKAKSVPVQKTKTFEQRRLDRETNPLPILSAREAICKRIRREKVLIVTAATGSGKVCLCSRLVV